jgi:hypothetical protein
MPTFEPGQDALDKQMRERTRLRDSFVRESVNAMEELGKRVRAGEIEKGEYDRKVAEIQGRIKSLNTEVDQVRNQAGVQERPAPQEKYYVSMGRASKRSENKRNLEFILIVASVLGLIFGIPYLYTHMMCVPVAFSSQAPRIISLLGLIQKKSPADYDLMCRYVKNLEFTTGNKPTSYSEGTLQVPLQYLTQPDDMTTAGLLIHDTCYQMMRSVIGGRKGMSEEDVERPCVRMKYMFLYRAGYFKSYEETVAALAAEKQGFGSNTVGANINLAFMDYQKERIYKYEGDVDEYCSKTKLRVEKLPDAGKYSIVLTNTGSTTIHCGFVELRVDSLEYPLACAELAPGRSYQSGQDFKLIGGEQYSVRVTGCDDATEYG